MLTYNIELEFTSPYIAHPYWPEMYEVIEITKKSGMNRAKSEANRRKSLEEYLRSKGMTLADYDKLVELSKRPFHMQNGKIIIPMENFMAFLVAANNQARAAFRASPPEQVWTRIQCTNLFTNKGKSDGIWKRFSTVNLGSGARASNQRGLRENEYIENFTAKGQISFDEETVDPQTLCNLIKWGGQFVGIGSSRKMGKGRFNLKLFEAVGLAEAAE